MFPAPGNDFARLEERVDLPRKAKKRAPPAPVIRADWPSMATLALPYPPAAIRRISTRSPSRSRADGHSDRSKARPLCSMRRRLGAGSSSAARSATVAARVLRGAPFTRTRKIGWFFIRPPRGLDPNLSKQVRDQARAGAEPLRQESDYRRRRIGGRGLAPHLPEFDPSA